MSLNDSKSRLAGLTREISLQWAETKESWRDAKGREFEQRYLVELFANMERTTIILDQMDELLKKVRNDCE